MVVMLLAALCSAIPGNHIISGAVQNDVEWSSPQKKVQTRIETRRSAETLKGKAKKTFTRKTTSKSKQSSTTIRTAKKIKTVINRTVTVISTYREGSNRISVTTVTKTVTTTYTYLAEKVKDKSAEKAQASPVICDIGAVASRADANVLKAFREFGMTVILDESAEALGVFEAEAGRIVLKRQDPCIYHELGHFLFFAAGGTDKLPAAKAVYLAEKELVTACNKLYTNADVREYFAEAYKSYVYDRGTLARERPQTYATVQDALSRVTDAQISRIKNIWSNIWAKNS